MRILVTGGLGYIGSHTCVELIQAGYDVVVLDNLSNSSLRARPRIEQIAGNKVDFIEGDIRDYECLTNLFEQYDIAAVIHFAGLKAVGESQEKPLLYHDVNVVGTHNLLTVMEEHNVRRIVFSSSATVYGADAAVPYVETSSVCPSNVYGNTKRAVEMMLEDMCRSKHSQWSASLLRYFNPIGAHESGLIGEDPKGIPNNLMPFIARVAVGKLPQLSVFGDDYPTKDGSGVRDYVHVVDLAKGHVKALQHLLVSTGVHTFNLGSGVGYSVLELVTAFERVNGIEIPYCVADRREGDLAEFYADPGKAWQVLGWKTELSIDQMMADTWRWQSNNPEGYEEDNYGEVDANENKPS
jgi:UDP-glucose 4-epimerase